MADLQQKTTCKSEIHKDMVQQHTRLYFKVIIEGIYNAALVNTIKTGISESGIDN